MYERLVLYFLLVQLMPYFSAYFIKDCQYAILPLLPRHGKQKAWLHFASLVYSKDIVAHEGQYFGAPGFENGRLQILMADFPAGKIYVFQYDPTSEQLTLRAELPRSAIKDCYNLMFQQSPLMLVRHSFEKRLQFLWPETAEFEIGNTETFYSREGDDLYFTRWFEDPDYREETVIRRWPTGEIVKVIPGTLMELPDGQRWVLQ